MSARSEFTAGVRAELPIVLGVVPFGLIYGVAAVNAGLPPAAAMAMSFIVFAGSAQFIAANLFGAGATALVLVPTTLVVNLRHVLYSASIAPYVQALPARWKWLLAYLLTDEAYAVTIVHYQAPGPLDCKHWFFLGAGLTLWISWQLSTAAGVFLAGQVPQAWALDFTLALTFIGLVLPALRDRPAVAAALSAGLTAVPAADLPLNLGLIVAAGVGIAIGFVLENNLDRSDGRRGFTTKTRSREGP